MPLFAITYDLVKQKDYQTLWDELERLGAHKALNSFYLVSLTNDEPQEIVDHLKQFIDGDDRLMVVRFIGKPKYTFALAGTNDWVKENT
ncbi:MAG: CRISPR-associated protein Cas2 [Alphaproteobacteria bacterium]|nr:CRISPR-associated protein Cas2 [Alphaproteobacteria bacterium]